MTKRILVVEDQEDNRQNIRDMFSALDYELAELKINGAQCWFELSDSLENTARAVAH